MQLNSSDKFINAIALNLPVSSRVLDLGSGNGGKRPATYAKLLGQHGYIVTAVDKEPMVVHNFSDWKNVTYVQKSVEQFLVDYTSQYDLVLMRCILPFISRECLNAAVNHVLPGGILYLLTFEPGDGTIQDKLLIPKEVLQAELKLMGLHEVVVEAYSQDDDHLPMGKHTHKMLALVYRKPV